MDEQIGGLVRRLILTKRLYVSTAFSLPIGCAIFYIRVPTAHFGQGVVQSIAEGFWAAGLSRTWEILTTHILLNPVILVAIVFGTSVQRRIIALLRGTTFESQFNCDLVSYGSKITALYCFVYFLLLYICNWVFWITLEGASVALKRCTISLSLNLWQSGIDSLLSGIGIEIFCLISMGLYWAYTLYLWHLALRHGGMVAVLIGMYWAVQLGVRSIFFSTYFVVDFPKRLCGWFDSEQPLMLLIHDSASASAIHVAFLVIWIPLALRRGSGSFRHLADSSS